ncbi:MAG TPA: cobalamin-dependent protein [Bryobacteraceae bacterium]|nr:cobalamin-dependent protein [Bryobacteraceae bacterium]
MANLNKVLKPLIKEPGAEPAGRDVIVTVKGGLHDIGKNLVASMLEGGGFEVIDLGPDVAPEKFIATIRERVHIVALSTLRTVTMPSMKTAVKALKAAGLRDRVKMIGDGAPVTKEYEKQIAADGYSETVIGAVAGARSDEGGLGC